MNTQRRHLLKLSAAMLGGLALHRPALAQTVTGPVRIVLPYPPGGSTDAITRFIADKLGTALKTNVIVDNRPGAAGMIGAAAVATAAPDGRTLLFTNTALIQSPLIQPQPLYNPLTDFEALTLVADAAQVLVASDATPARTLPEYVEWARKHPGSAYGSLGVGSTGHLYGELLKRKAGINIVHAAYKGDTAAIGDLLANQLGVGFVSTVMAKTYGDAGRIKVLATLGRSRVPSMPNVPTFAEAGFSGFESIGWIGMLAPARTPAPLVQRLSNELATIIKTPAGSKMLIDSGMLPRGTTAQEFAALLRRDQQVWQTLVAQSGIKTEG
ncbi:Bug family tripartite tricarboxylate transporter substrate binding protein [Cupriavidus metallidurans]|uniref:Bug family tripartite tricarboxylate transporter substrate binding protein n=1 Tax=Cupriavidus metallidurans TaxID=119219 RepID=UPI001BFC9162|nr:tripartite tricarboxylate transporter substrate-binding protein [Cupriavidus metallidurans]QWC92014.1 tripartite tricarboxylate transporter substrate binding protein [Cupriavidus metallidurans]